MVYVAAEFIFRRLFVVQSTVSGNDPKCYAGISAVYENNAVFIIFLS